MPWLRFLGLSLLLLGTGIAAADLPLRVTDDQGNMITLTHPARRIISLAPHITELLYESGAGDQVVGVVNYSDYPEAAKSKPNVGSYNNINIEQIIALQPDLIIAYSGGNPPDQQKQLQKLGIPVYFSNPETLSEVIRSVRQLGLITGHAEAANHHADQLQLRYQQLQDKYADADPVTIFIQIWHDPLLTVDNSHIIGRVVKLCGGNNIFPDMVTRFANVSLESVIALNPQAILLSDSHGNGQPIDLASPGWSAVQASQNRQVLSIDENLLFRASGRLLQGAEQLCHKLDGVRQYYAGKTAAANRKQHATQKRERLEP